MDSVEFEQHVLAQFEVEGGERLVEQKELWLVYERARYRYALFLPATYGVGLAGGEPFEADD